MAHVVLGAVIPNLIWTLFMQCTSCCLHSDNLREYSRVVDLGSHRKAIDTVLLCPACRVFNAINPKFVMRRAELTTVAIDEIAANSNAGAEPVYARL